MEAGLRPVRECHQLCLSPTMRERFEWSGRIVQRQDSVCGCSQQFAQNQQRLPATIRSSIREPNLGTEDSFHLASYVLVGDGFAVIEGGEALTDLLPKPFVMVKVARNQLANDLVRSFARLRGDSG